MTRLWFIVPAHGRVDVTRVCLRQLARTCEALAGMDIEASAVVVADDANLSTARDLGFATVERDNDQLGRKFNDGFQLACDPEFNPRPADYAVPCGSDDWLDPIIFRHLPPADRIGIFRQLAVVNEEQTHLSRLRVGYKAGCGIRIIPRSLIARAGYRPAEEDRKRAVDSSAYEGMKRATGAAPATAELDVHSLQIIDWKSRGTQLNSYQAVRLYRRGEESEDPFATLAGVYPDEALAEMRELSA